MKICEENISVLMSVYKNDDAKKLLKALKSVYEQTIRPSEIILVLDGPVSKEILEEIKKYKKECPVLKVIVLKENLGLGSALEIGLKECKSKYVARMDSDDISIPERFECQLKMLIEHPDISIVGSFIEEFVDGTNEQAGIREVPLEHEKIVQYMKRRCPFNHVTVMFRKEDVLKCGGYKPWLYNEDYYLWLRMFENNCRFANLPKCLVKVRVGQEMYNRRGGKMYFKSECAIQKYMLQHHIIGIGTFLENICIRFFVQKLFPNRVRQFLYKNFFRKGS